jgi:GTPase Era involved in 16S rRNA processing
MIFSLPHHVHFSTTTSPDKLLQNIRQSTANGNGLLNLLTSHQRNLLTEQKKISQQTLTLAKQIGGVDLHYSATFPLLREILTPHADDEMKARKDRERSEWALDSTFSVVVAGEYNAGKSTLINALLGRRFLETGSLPTTDQITVLTSCSSSSSSIEGGEYHGEKGTGLDDDDEEKKGTQVFVSEEDLSTSSTSTTTAATTTTTTTHSNAIVVHRIPNVPLLQDLSLIDTPGTNAVLSNHTARTLKLLPSADLILFVTSADRPFPESERLLLQSIQAYRKNIVIVINKMDILDASGGDHGEKEKKKVANFVSENAADLLGSRAVVLSISAKDALAAKLIHGKDNERTSVWRRSNFSSLENFLKESLTEETKIQAKLLNPLGVTEGMLNDCVKVLNVRRKELDSDLATVNLLKNQMISWKRDMEQDVSRFEKSVHEVLVYELERCRSFMNNLGWLERYGLCFNGDESQWNAKWDDTKSITVSQGIESELLSMTKDFCDDIATSSRAQGQAVIEYLGKRPAVVGQNLIGSVTAASRFDDTRKDLLEKMSHALKSVYASYDANAEKTSLFQSVKNATYLSCALHVLAASSGVVTAIQMVDAVPGTMATVGLAMSGAGVLSYSNQHLVRDYESKWKQREEKLNFALSRLCSKEIERIHKRILDGVSPYTRYVETEEEVLKTLNAQCEALSSSTQILRNRILKTR